MARREAVVRRALEDGEVIGLRGDRRCGLDAARARADQPDALPGEVDAIARPRCGEVDVTVEAVEPGDVRRDRCRQASDRGHEKARRHRVVAVGADLPAVRRVVERGRGDAGGELDVASEIEAIGDVVEVPLDLGLLRVTTRPLPLLRKLRGERVAVVVTLGVAPRAGIAIPVPRAADTVAGLEDADAQVQVVTELVERVETGEARADHDHVEVRLIIHRADRIRRSPPPPPSPPPSMCRSRGPYDTGVTLARSGGGVSGRSRLPATAGRGVAPATGRRPGAVLSATASAPASRHRATRSGARATWSGGHPDAALEAQRVGIATGVGGRGPHREPRRFEAAAGLYRWQREPSVGEPPDARQRRARGAAPDPDRDGSGRQRRDAGGVDHLRRAGVIDARLGPEPAQQRDLLLHAGRTVEKSIPSAWYSTSFHPMPTPRRMRPGASRASVATCFATSAVWRCGSTRTSVTSSRLHARAR